MRANESRPRRALRSYTLVVSVGTLIMGWCCVLMAWGDDFWREQRQAMVNTQIVRRGVKDPLVITAMLKVERHRFVPESVRKEAYEDYPLPIGEGQTISQPYVVAFMTEALKLDSNCKVLEVGTGSGYQAAVLAEICDSVYTIEIIESLARSAEKLLLDLGYRNIAVRVGDGYQGWKEAAPFDAIIVTCAPSHIPKPLEEQLAEGGRMVIPVGKKYAQELVLLKKINGRLKRQSILPVRFVPMLRKDGGEY